jgi:hypothetical protein
VGKNVIVNFVLGSIFSLYYNLGNIDKGPLQVQGNATEITCGVAKITPLKQGLV